MHEHTFLGAATVGERGQVSIPAEARRACSIEPGDKILFFAAPKHSGLIAVKAEELGRLIKHLTSTAQGFEQIMTMVDAGEAE